LKQNLAKVDQISNIEIFKSLRLNYYSSPISRLTQGMKMPNKPNYHRVLLKISGEGLMGQQEFGLDPKTVSRICKEVKSVHDQGVQVCLVIGAGNIFRGVSGDELGIERTSADYMGMLATVINAIAVQSALEVMGVNTRVLSAIPMSTVCEPYIRRRAVRHMERGRVVIFAAGTGNPFFTTDTAAALRAVEMGCDALLKGTQVDGVYDKDPKYNQDAKRYSKLSYQDVLSRDLRVMDTSAIALARDNKLPILVFAMHKSGGFSKVVSGVGKYTIIK
jgi:uridylate kinase